jgi:hypothetical protein
VGKDVLFLHGGVHDNFLFLDLVTMESHGDFQNFAHTVFPDATPKIGQLGWVARQLPGEPLLTAEGLEVGVLNPDLDNALIAQVFKLLEDEKPNHQTDRFGWAAGCSVERTKAVLKNLPRDDLCQPQQVVSRIELIDQIWAEEAALTVRFFGLHR